MAERFKEPEHRTDLYRLPSGDWINVGAVQAARISMKASRSGEVGGIAYINADSSWYTIAFGNAEDAKAFVDALIEYRNQLHRPRVASVELTREVARELIGDMRERAQ